jgi:hypothetical protein
MLKVYIYRVKVAIIYSRESAMLIFFRHFALLAVALATAISFEAHADDAHPLLTLHYRNAGHLILLPVSVNGSSPEWFCLDSGAPHSVIDPALMRKLNLRTFGKGTTTGTGSGKVEMAHSEPVTLTLGNVALNVSEPWVIDLSGVPIPKDVRGLVGADLFKAYVVRIDPLASELELFEAKGFSFGDIGTPLPLYFDNDKLFIDVTLDVKPGLSVTHRIRIDTGAEESVSDPIVAQSEETKKTTLGNGLGANFEALSGVFAAVHIGPYTIRHVWGPGAPQMTIGMEIFRRFITTFDTQHGVIHLVPNRTLIEPVPPPGG